MQPNDAFRRTTSKPSINIHTHAKGLEIFGVAQNHSFPKVLSAESWPLQSDLTNLPATMQSGFTLEFIILLQPDGKSAKGPKKKKKIPQIPVRQ